MVDHAEVSQALFRQLCLFTSYVFNRRWIPDAAEPTSKDLAERIYNSFMGTIQLAAFRSEPYEFTELISLRFDQTGDPYFKVEKDLRTYWEYLQESVEIPIGFKEMKLVPQRDSDSFLLTQTRRALTPLVYTVSQRDWALGEPLFPWIPQEASKRMDELRGSLSNLASKVRTTLVENIFWFLFRNGQISLSHFGIITADVEKNQVRVAREDLEPVFRSYLELALRKRSKA